MVKEGDYFRILHQSWGHLQLGRNWCCVPSFKARNCTPVTLQSHSSPFKLISFHKRMPSFQTFYTLARNCFQLHTHKTLTSSLWLQEAAFLVQGKLWVVGSQLVRNSCFNKPSFDNQISFLTNERIETFVSPSTVLKAHKLAMMIYPWTSKEKAVNQIVLTSVHKH